MEQVVEKNKTSRVGRKPVPIPAGVSVQFKNNLLTVKGKKGELAQTIIPGVNVNASDKSVSIILAKGGPKTRALQGLYRALAHNMIKGVVEGFSKRLSVRGLGFKASKEGAQLKLTLGYSHPIFFDIPKGIDIAIDKSTKANEFPLIISGINKQLVGQVAADIRRLKPPEYYKGTGIRYEDEVVSLKAGKKAGK